jgi:predicted helicase
MSKIFHASLKGLATFKNQELLVSDISTTEWSSIEIEASEYYLLIPQSYNLKIEYDRGWKVTDIFPVNSVGIITGQDGETIAAKKSDAELLAQRHNLPISTIKSILYRPFDTRHIVYDSNVVTRLRCGVMQHMLMGDNLGAIICSQQSQQGEWSLCGITDSIIESSAISNKTREINSLFPLYLYPTTAAEKAMGMEKRPNISEEFYSKVEFILGYKPTPEAIFYYIYAILHSRTYRNHYAEFIKRDFPRVPITRNVDLFHQLGELGEKLVNLHLMKSPILNQTSSPFIDNGGGCIVDAGHPKYESGKVVINKQKDGFMDVPEAVWNFHVGGYQVCQKWLKDRKGRTLSQDDIGHYQKIVVALGQSIDLMAKIDAAIPNWPMDAEYN